MKNIFKNFAKKQTTIKFSQKVLLDFVDDTENIKKAAHGSMEKRLKLIEKASRTQAA